MPAAHSTDKYVKSDFLLFWQSPWSMQGSPPYVERPQKIKATVEVNLFLPGPLAGGDLYICRVRRRRECLQFFWIN